VTDGQTDRILIARPRLHFMQRGKNERDCILEGLVKFDGGVRCNVPKRVIFDFQR